MTARATLPITAVLLIMCPLGCATRVEPSSSLQPKLGHSQHVEPPATSDPVPEPHPSPDPAEPPQPPSGTNEPGITSDPAATEPEPAIPPPAPVSEEDEALCSHITGVVLSESNNAAGLSPDQIDELIASCSVALAQDRRKLGEAEFRRRADCVRKAKTVAGFSACS